MLQVNNLSRKVSGNWIWENISFELSAGQRLALSGTSGSGKSMLLRALVGLDVLEKEPPELKNPLLNMENVIITPHAASGSSRMRPASRRRVGNEIVLAINGKWPRSSVNP